MKSKEFIEKLKLAAKLKTLYVSGGFGAPAGHGNNRERYIQHTSYNKQPDVAKSIKEASADTFFFDCVCLGKGILWGWNGDAKKIYGGANYCANGVPDFTSESVPTSAVCTDVSTDMNPAKIIPGEWLYMVDHVGYYIGDGLVIESTPKWENKVQVRKLSDRPWKWHGKCKYIDYSDQEVRKLSIVCPCCGAEFVKA